MPRHSVRKSISRVSLSYTYLLAQDNVEADSSQHLLPPAGLLRPNALTPTYIVHDIDAHTQPFLPIKHALLGSKSERGISSDSPGIQLAQALLDCALAGNVIEDSRWTSRSNSGDDVSLDVGLLDSLAGHESKGKDKDKMQAMTRSRSMSLPTLSRSQTVSHDRIRAPSVAGEMQLRQSTASSGSRRRSKSTAAQAKIVHACPPECQLCNDDGDHDDNADDKAVHHISATTSTASRHLTSSALKDDGSPIATSSSKTAHEARKAERTRRTKSLDLSAFLRFGGSAAFVPHARSVSVAVAVPSPAAASSTTWPSAVSPPVQGSAGRAFSKQPILEEEPTSLYHAPSRSISEQSKSRKPAHKKRDPTDGLNRAGTAAALDRRRASSVSVGSSIAASSLYTIAEQEEMQSTPAKARPSSKQTNVEARSSVKARDGRVERRRSLKTADKKAPPVEAASQGANTLKSEVKSNTTISTHFQAHPASPIEDNWELITSYNKGRSGLQQASSAIKPTPVSAASPRAPTSHLDTISQRTLSPPSQVKSNDRNPRKRIIASKLAPLSPALGRLSKRSRSVSANDVLHSTLTKTIQGGLLHATDVGEERRSLDEVILPLSDSWSKQLHGLLSTPSTADFVTSSRTEQGCPSSDDSGFVSLSDLSITSTTAPAIPESDEILESLQAGLPRIPTLAHLSHMGTLRRYISCPDGILQVSKSATCLHSIPLQSAAFAQVAASETSDTQTSQHTDLLDTLPSSTSIATSQASSIPEVFQTARTSAPKLRPPPEELFAALFNARRTALANERCQQSSSQGHAQGTAPRTKVSASQSVAADYAPATFDDRAALQLLPRDLDGDLRIKPWLVTMPAFVLDDLDVGLRPWDRDRLEVSQAKLRQVSI